MGHTFRHILRYCPTEAMELFMALLAVGWGIRLGWPGPDPFLTSPSLRPLLVGAPAWGWGAALLLVGGVHLTGLLRGTGRLRRLAPGTMCGLLLLWSMITVSIIVANPQAPGLWTYALIAAKHSLLLMRLLVDRRPRHDPS